jgi:hypothetical protein
MSDTVTTPTIPTIPTTRKYVHEDACVFDVQNAIQDLRAAGQADLQTILSVCDEWAREIPKSAARDVPGAVFMSLWLKRGSLEALLRREFDDEYLVGEWHSDGRSLSRCYPVGLVGHWPAANVKVQPLLSAVCALLGGNTALVRVPPTLVEDMEALLAPLARIDPDGWLMRHIALISFPHEDIECHEAMARSVDGAMIWGGAEPIKKVRTLPFPHWAQIATFGPRTSLAVIDRGAWQDQAALDHWSVRLARDVWQFDQRACSSPQSLCVECGPDDDIEPLTEALAEAFAREQVMHPQETPSENWASVAAMVRAEHLLNDPMGSALFPSEPDWSILVHSYPEDDRDRTLPHPIQGRTLHVVPVRDTADVAAFCDGDVQTIGLAFADSEAERRLAIAAAARGVDRLVRLGTMHVFDSPWDGRDLVRPFTRLVRHSTFRED